MYWCRIATAADEEQIAALNYEAFVEEIPQHKTNIERKLVDRFHDENTYMLVLKEDVVIGMVAFREQRPFSLDGKIGPVEAYLPEAVCEKLCELRLLTIRKAYRNGRALLRLFKALYAYFYEQGYTGVVISGTVREEKMYKDIGFTQFAPAVGTVEASYLPMVITKEAITRFRARILKDRKVFYPGPVAQQPIQAAPISHRSIDGQRLYEQCMGTLRQLASSRYVAILAGSGTVANETMLATIRSQFKQQPGLIISNGEFGERLVKQANAWGLSFEHISYRWGEPFQLTHIENKLQAATWLLFVHGETSVGTLNPLEEIIQLGKRYRTAVCVDCISSFGALPFSLEDVYLATATSGKAIGAVAGLAFVFYNEQIVVNNVPSYLNLTYYHQQMPYTLPTYLLQNINEQLAHYPARFDLLQQRLQQVLSSAIMKDIGIETTHYPMIVSCKATDFVQCASVNDFDLHADSQYLKKAELAQISMIQPSFERDFSQLKVLYEYYRDR